MAKQLGPIFIEGTFDGLCYYKSRGQYYVRKSNPPTSKQVKTDKRFRGTMRESDLFANTPCIASFVYRSLPVTFRQNWMFKAFMGEASGLLREGKTVEEVKMILWKTYAEVWVNKEVFSLVLVTTDSQSVRSDRKKKHTAV